MDEVRTAPSGLGWRRWGFPVVLAGSLLLCWSSPPAAAAGADPAILVFALFGYAHLMWLGIKAIAWMHTKAQADKAEVARLERAIAEMDRFQANVSER